MLNLQFCELNFVRIHQNHPPFGVVFNYGN